MTNSRASRSSTSPSTKRSKEVDAYLAKLPAAPRAALQKIRNAVAAAAPDAVEGFSYGVPAFRLDGRPLIGYSAAKDFCSVYPMSGTVLRLLAKELEGFDTLKGTIHFTLQKPLPIPLVRKLVKARIAEIRDKNR
jgi:uncharacterized protein YdhG (YjbR/CyaY superfamily)